MAENYFAELEREWKQNRKTADGATLQKLFKSPLGHLQRPKSLHGPDFIKELLRLAVLTKDIRFEAAAFALMDHDIVDEHFNFLRWTGPDMARVQREFELEAFVFMYWLTSIRGIALRRACAQFAAFSGWPGVSFAAAIKDLELIYRRRLAKNPRYDPDENKIALDMFKQFLAAEYGVTKLEFLCSASIPTTANN